MPSSHQQPTRLTKKQKKATAFRERGSGSGKSKGKGLKGKGTIGKPPNPTPGHSRPLTTTTTGDNGENGYDDDDEDANAIPAMEDQDQALVAMAGYTEERDAKGDDSVQSRRAVSRVQKKAAMESTSTSTAAQNKSKRKRGSSRAEEAEAQPGPKKKAKLARSSEEILPAREDDGVTSMNDDDDDDGGDGSKKGSSKPLRYILFIGNVSAPTIDRAERLALALISKGNLKYTTTREAIQKHFALCGAFPHLTSPSSPFHFTKDGWLRSPTPTQTHRRRYAYLRPKSHVRQPPPSPSPKAAHSSSSQRGTRCTQHYAYTSLNSMGGGSTLSSPRGEVGKATRG
jgi:hypothetical protein